jgi:hypothetical protein
MNTRIFQMLLGMLACAMVSAATGCASTGSNRLAAGESDESTDWSLSGSRIIACCCNAPCPCRINKKPTHCHGCDNTNVVHIDHGAIRGIKVDGLTWVWVSRGFAEDPSTNWGYTYISDSASDAQFEALTWLMTENAKAIDPKKMQYLAGKDLGVRRVPMTWTKSADGREWRLSMPGILELQTRSIILPGRVEPARSSGIFDDYGDSFIHADTVVHTYNDPSIGYAWNLTGRQANQANFVLNPDRLAKGGIGWGCWSAHSDFDNESEYQERVTEHP